MAGLLRRKRMPDGSFGELEKVFPGETAEEKVERLEADNAALEATQAALTLMLIEKGVL